MNLSRKNELGQFGMFSRMASHAQHLNVVGVSSFYWMLRMRFNMVSLKVISCSAFFTLASFFYKICNYATRFMCSFRRPIIPFWMVGSRHFPASGQSHAWYRTIISRSTIAFSCLKFFSTFFATMINHCFAFGGFDFVRTFFRASICFSTIMSFKDLKFFCASGTDKSNLSSPFKFSIGVCHG